MQALKSAEKKSSIEIAARLVLLSGISFIISFIITNTVFLDTIAPSGICLIAASRKNSKINLYGVILGALLGALTLKSQLIGVYSSAAVIMGGLTILQKYTLKNNSRLVSYLMVAVSFLSAFLLFKNKTPYDFIVTIFEIFLSFVLIYIFEKALSVFFASAKKNILSEEEIVCSAFLALSVLLSFGWVKLAGISPVNIICMFAVLTVSYIGGAGLGAILGATLGMLSSLTLGTGVGLIASMSFMALIAGLFKRSNKYFAALSFTMINIVFVILTLTATSNELVPILESIIAAAIFLTLPNKMLKSMARFVDINVLRTYEQEIHFNRFKKATVGRLKEIANVFFTTGELFKTTAEENANIDSDVSGVIEEVAARTCESCVFCRTCWGTDFINTYSILQKMYVSHEKYGRIDRTKIPLNFQKKCMDINTLIKNAQNVFAGFLINARWKKKVEESRLVTGEQLVGVSRIIGALGYEMDLGLSFLDEAEEDIRNRLVKNGIAVKEVAVESFNSSVSVYVKTPACKGNHVCHTIILKEINESLGKKMMLREYECYPGKKVCDLRYEEKKKLSVMTGVASLPKKKVSGDTHSFLTLKDGRYLSILCDGMGSGEKARKESDAAVSLIENFYKAGFDDKTVFDTINRLMILKGPNDMFSTVDVCMLDLVKCSAQFTKIGAERSYILHEGEVSKVEAGALPIGILDEVTPATSFKTIAPDDYIVMVTDGISDLFEEEEMSEIIEGTILEDSSPQTAAENILRLALSRIEDKMKDDMTVMVTKAYGEQEN
ncbi:MAG: stage II sporulation protein E [Eubacteriales bacterium]